MKMTSLYMDITYIEVNNMDIVLCATRNMYPHLKTLILMLHETQPKLHHIYAIIEDDKLNPLDYVTYINVNNYPRVTKNIVNDGNKWTYMCWARCYLTEILPELDKVLYLDLDIYIDQDISQIWDIDIENYAVAGVVDFGAKLNFLPYIPHIGVYINSGVMLMNLKYWREHNITERIHQLLNTYVLSYPDQDAINIVCYGHIKFLSHKWNSNQSTGYHHRPIINHGIPYKPWHVVSPFFKEWVGYYLRAN